MNNGLWVLQIILAIKFLLAAYTHLFRTRQSQWLAGVRKMDRQARLGLTTGGVFSVLGALGLILPAATGILPWLTPLAAALLGLLMVRGIVFHLRCRDRPNVVVGIVLVILCAIVAYGRWGLVP